MIASTGRSIIAAAALLSAAIVPTAVAQPPGLDLGAIKPRSADSATTPAASPIGVSPLKKPTDTATTDKGSPAPGGIGTAIKNPLAKGVLGAGGAAKPATQEEAASSNDVVVKMPSNMKK